MIEYAKNLGKDSGIRDMRAIPRQEVVYVMMGDHRDMKGIDARGSRQNRFSQNLFGDVQDCPLNRQDRDTRQRLQSALCEGGISINCLVEHVLRGYEFVVQPLRGPPPLRKELPRRGNDLTAWSAP
jgi:hypothetical protein